MSAALDIRIRFFREEIFGICVKTDTIIPDCDPVVGRMLPDPDRDRPAFRLFPDPMADCVFHDGLQRQGRQKEMAGADIIHDFQIFPITHLFQDQIMLQTFQLPVDGNEAGIIQYLQIDPQVLGEFVWLIISWTRAS